MMTEWIGNIVFMWVVGLMGSGMLLGYFIIPHGVTDQEKLCYFNHGTGASYENGECRVITVYR